MGEAPPTHPLAPAQPRISFWRVQPGDCQWVGAGQEWKAALLAAGDQAPKAGQRSVLRPVSPHPPQGLLPPGSSAWTLLMSLPRQSSFATSLPYQAGGGVACCPALATGDRVRFQMNRPGWGLGKPWEIRPGQAQRSKGMHPHPAPLDLTPLCHRGTSAPVMPTAGVPVPPELSLAAPFCCSGRHSSMVTSSGRL